MTRTEVSFDDYDAECIAFLIEHFDREGEHVDIDAFPRYAEVGHERVMKRSSSSVMILLTPNSIDRPWVLLETGAAWALDKTLIPVMAFVDPSRFVDPLKDIQARRIETSQQKFFTSCVASRKE